ncbi:MAG TPA: hypothetical protein VGQ39_15970 [Pyrinomonadaceae bacterium]|nr:hypothetical protein [Pyrinomonadaceae bacterium]
MIRSVTRMLVSVAFFMVVFNSASLACGPFSMEAVFVFTAHPAYPLNHFAHGEIGVVQPSYARSYLYVAYRHLANAPFHPQEEKALTEIWDERLNGTWDGSEDSWVKAWLETRQKVAGLPESPKIEAYRNREKPNQYETFLNCNEDSFDSAIATLNERIKKYGADSPTIRTWIEGQDQVFSNCGAGQNLPSALPSDADALAQADRRYQIAAANFYSTKFEEARKEFDAIAADSSSSWQTVASYLIARTLVRQASLGADETKKDLLIQAETQIKKVLADKKLASTHAASRRLLDIVRLRLRPSERMHELAHTLMNKTANDHLKQDLWDYTILLDGVLGPDEPAPGPLPMDELRSDDLTDWISTIQRGSADDVAHALSRWQTTHAETWLIAALARLDEENAKVPDLIRAALNVKATSAAFASARFYAIRLLIGSGKLDEARSLLDQLLKKNQAQFDASSLNLLIDDRMMLATSLADFLSHAPRIPAALSWNEDGREIPAEASDLSDEGKTILGKQLFDDDTAKSLNTQMPLGVLKEAATSQTLPPHLRRDLAQATWIRAVLLGDFKTADELVPELKALVPSLSGNLDDFLRTPQAEVKKFSALYTWLKFPGIEPIVDTGMGRSSALNQQDTYRDNWWCGASFTPSTEPIAEENDALASFTTSGIHSPVFLTDAQRAAGGREWKALNSLGAIPNYLCKQVILWSTKSPTDPRVPEALHLAVTSTRYGCTDENTGRWSKAAFDLLHRKYPSSTWAKKTKYWFKE